MKAKKARGALDMRDIAQSLKDSSEELAAVSETLQTMSVDGYPAQELSIMVGVRVKLAYNCKKLKQLTGQEDPADFDQPF